MRRVFAHRFTYTIIGRKKQSLFTKSLKKARGASGPARHFTRYCVYIILTRVRIDPPRRDQALGDGGGVLQQIAAADAGDRGADLATALGVVEKAHERGDAGDLIAAFSGGFGGGYKKARGESRRPRSKVSVSSALKTSASGSSRTAVTVPPPSDSSERSTA